ncbi:MAG: hypothetical protein ACRDAM_20185 [Casimicrobium sp.]
MHFGATSQDAIDTAMMLCSKRALAMIDAELGRVVYVLAGLARAHRATPNASAQSVPTNSRTLHQSSSPAPLA